jgi:peptidoglycan biosynthesis protein MviN/MurJ (putative lipid II flippase)
LLFERGQFTVEAANLTALSIRWLSLGLVPYVMYTILRQVLIARKKTRIDGIISLTILGGKLVLLFLLTPRYGLVGIAISGLVAMLFGSIACGFVASRMRPISVTTA